MDEVRLILYNNQHLPKKTKENNEKKTKNNQTNKN